MQFQLPFEKPIYELEEQLSRLEAQQPSPTTLDAIQKMRLEIQRMKREVFENLDPWDIVKVARHPDRPQSRDYLELIFDDFMELHGDRAFGDDKAIVTGFARLEGIKVMFVGQQKGRTLKDRNECFYGCAHPEGYRKALLKMQLAAKHRLPVVCLIDTPGAYPGIRAEERGQAYTIAVNLREMSVLETPILCVVIGEGGSGGALGIGIGDYIGMLQFSYYSVISPEGCAGILWKHVQHADKAARALKFTSRDLLRLGVIDEIIPEPLGGAHRDHRQMASTLKGVLLRELQKWMAVPIPQLLEQRYAKFRKMGVFLENTSSFASQEPRPAPEATLETARQVIVG